MPSDRPDPPATGLQPCLRGLHATPATALPFQRGVVVRSFVLQRRAGNVIIYHSPGITAAAAAIEALGPPTRLLINHWHEAMFDPPGLDVPIEVHAADRSRTRLPITATFRGDEALGDDLRLIHTPGHTAGTTMVLWDNGEDRLLFPGDSLWVEGGEWKAVLLPDSDREAYVASLVRLRDVPFDMLVPWGSEADQPCWYAVTPAQKRDTLDRIIDRLRAGQDA